MDQEQTRLLSNFLKLDSYQQILVPWNKKERKWHLQFVGNVGIVMIVADKTFVWRIGDQQEKAESWGEPAGRS